jgi:hypothetical protein
MIDKMYRHRDRDVKLLAVLQYNGQAVGVVADDLRKSLAFADLEHLRDINETPRCLIRMVVDPEGVLSIETEGTNITTISNTEIATARLIVK